MLGVGCGVGPKKTAIWAKTIGWGHLCTLDMSSSLRSGRGLFPSKVFQYSLVLVSLSKWSFVNHFFSTWSLLKGFSLRLHNLMKSLFFCITKTRRHNFDPLKPHFYTVKLGFTGVYINFLIFARKHRLWVFIRTTSPRRF